MKTIYLFILVLLIACNNQTKELLEDSASVKVLADSSAKKDKPAPQILPKEVNETFKIDYSKFECMPISYCYGNERWSDFSPGTFGKNNLCL